MARTDDQDARGIVANLVLADLGFASSQVDDPARGLSFMREGPLDMRLDCSSGMTARDLIASVSERLKPGWKPFRRASRFLGISPRRHGAGTTKHPPSQGLGRAGTEHSEHAENRKTWER